MTEGRLNIETLKPLILDLIGKAGPGRSISPVDAAMAAGGKPNGPKPAWRQAMRMVELAARALEEEGLLVVLKKGKPVPFAEARGVVRYGAADAGRRAAESDR